MSKKAYADPCQVWMEQHPEEVAKYAGKRVAVHPTLGIVASGDTFGECYEAVPEGMMGQVVFDVVPIPGMVYV
jgi:hypothetical protein